MKFAAATTLLFATLALANPAPVAQPEAEAIVPSLASEVDARAAGLRLEERKSKPKAPKNSNNSNDTSAAGTFLPNRALELGAIGLGVVEIVRLWA
ncbi:hypothetical protein CC80DRAFT_487048 [Byssothecium circinans]|uniref:Uncharacterized protein n=1 Tax=Byssothecium circinans TaxID=147558 RepID=A0A6A5UG08_9PLEO|nr:hypothetical protein CC80DRAFT_487048 [Byssothecium circinans]